MIFIIIYDISYIIYDVYVYKNEVANMNVYSTKKEIIYHELKKEIQEGKYEFGEKLVISRLAKRFGTSEIPVREAINQLNSDNLIEFTPHVGAVVSTLSSKDIQEIFEVRIELEGLASRLAAENINEEIINNLRSIITASEDCLEKNDFEEIEKLNMKFHLTIYEASDNLLLIGMIRDLWNNTKRYPSLFSNNRGHAMHSIKEHKFIVEALEMKDPVLVENAMMKHKANAAKEVLRITQQDYYNNLDIVN
ncbi:GntR family transcriptional regulator [Oceanobacillus sojae]